MQGTIKNDVRRRIRIRIHTKRFDHFYCKKWEILRAAIVGDNIGDLVPPVAVFWYR